MPLPPACFPLLHWPARWLCSLSPIPPPPLASWTFTVDITELISPSLTMSLTVQGWWKTERGQLETVEAGELEWREVDRGGGEGVGKRNCSRKREGEGGSNQGGWNKDGGRGDGRDSAEGKDADGQENGILNWKRLFFCFLYLCQSYPHLPLSAETERSHVWPLCYVHFWE